MGFDAGVFAVLGFMGDLLVAGGSLWPPSPVLTASGARVLQSIVPPALGPHSPAREVQ